MRLFSIYYDEILSLNKRGILPGPGEGCEDFLKRARNLIFNSSSSINKTVLDEKLKEVFDITCNWVHFEYSNKGMYFWEAAYVKVVNNKFIMRLNRFFEKKDTYLGMYHKNEIIAHECSHVARMSYSESKFEEMFAYNLSKGFRKVFGPLFQSSHESLVLILLVAFSMTCDLTLFNNFKVILFSKAIPGLYLLALSTRLFLKRRVFFRALKKIKELLENSQYGMALLFRLTDSEIIFFGKRSKKEIKEYIFKQTELRWQIIKASYPIK